MAHAGVLLALALAGGVLSLDTWPPTWVPKLWVFCRRWVAFVGFVVPWVLVHIYVRWQLRNRRYAAFVYAGALRAMGRCVQIPLTPDDLVAYRPEAPKRDLFARFAGVVDGFVIPLPKAAIPEDVGKEEFPNWIGKAVREQEQKGTGALKAEWMETAGSFLAIFAVLLRTWFDP